MNINTLVEKIQSIVLNRLEFQQFRVGNTWDMSAGKGDKYPCVWMEFPVLVDYVTNNKLTKDFVFSIDFLNLAKLDDTRDEINHISHMEEYADIFLQLLRKDLESTITANPTGLSVRSFNADNACGIRLDIKITTGRYCIDDDLTLPYDVCPT
jgi:hypothetical protein